MTNGRSFGELSSRGTPTNGKFNAMTFIPVVVFRDDLNVDESIAECGITLVVAPRLDVYVCRTSERLGSVSLVIRTRD